jgi:TATA-box binding protein (TBP) (component of TFIID and TFIIIB)
MDDTHLTPQEFMRRHLAHPEIPYLVPGPYPLPVYHNVVSNAKLNPAEPIPLLKLLAALSPNCEHKQSFGAIIVRYMHQLTESQRLIEDLKLHAVTHLCFGTGALGSTGNRSKDEARLSGHEFRMELYNKLGIETDFWRFTIPNMVGSADLGHSVDLAALHAAAPQERSYDPDLFPGVFMTYTYVHQDRMAVRESVIGKANTTVRRKVQFVEGDFEQFQKRKAVSAAPERGAAMASSKKPRQSEEDRHFVELQARRENFFRDKKEVVALVFKKGNVVLLGVNDMEISAKAMQYVAEIAARFKPTPEKEAEWAAAKKQQAQKSLSEKTEAIKEVHVNYRAPLSETAGFRISELANKQLDKEAYSRALMSILKEEKINKKRKKKEDDMAELAAIAQGGMVMEAMDPDEADAEIDRLIAEADEPPKDAGEVVDPLEQGAQGSDPEAGPTSGAGVLMNRLHRRKPLPVRNEQLVVV